MQAEIKGYRRLALIYQVFMSHYNNYQVNNYHITKMEL